jgi:hypothetical protein
MIRVNLFLLTLSYSGRVLMAENIRKFYQMPFRDPSFSKGNISLKPVKILKFSQSRSIPTLEGLCPSRPWHL